MDKVYLNDVPVDIWDYEEDTFELGDKTLKELSFKFDAQGVREYELIKNLLGKKELSARFNNNEEFNTKVSSWSYQSPPDGEEDIVVTFSVTLKEVDPDYTEWDLDKGLFLNSVMNWARTRALFEILEEKGYTTKQDYDERIKTIQQRDWDEMTGQIIDGPNYKEKSE